MSPAPGFRLLEHTADMGIEAHAETQPGLFIAMAQGLAAVIFSVSSVEPTTRVSVQLAADNAIELLVAWLNEILYLCESRRLIPAAFQILALTETSLDAVVVGDVFDPARHGMERQAKAVTYHQAQLRQTSEGWVARVYVDL